MPINSVQAEGSTQIFNLGLIINDLNATEREWCMNWISQFDPFAKWNFILWRPYKNLDDATFVNFLKMRGSLMGVDGYAQIYTLSQRESDIDSMVNTFNAHNITLKGFFMFQPDTYTMNYAYSRYNFEYLVGYCFDQYMIDYMTMKGSWQLPYYHNSEHALKPAEDNKGLVVFPHAIWDWVSSLTYNHRLNTHVLNVYPHIYSNSSQAINYCLKLINESLSCSEPFGYASTMFEWTWINRQDLNETATNYYQQIINQHHSICQLYNETTSWFKSLYSKTPTYRVTFTSPYENQQVEWYLDLNCRIARVGSYVKSYVIFKNQTEYWLDHICYVDFGKSASGTNCIDNSLKFEIDDLGGGYDRDTAKGGSMYYTGNLVDFPSLYNTLVPTLLVNTFKNDAPTASNITLFDENGMTIDIINGVSSYERRLVLGTYYIQASIFYNLYMYASGQVRVDLTECTELAINFLFGNLTVSCVDVENRPLTNCAVIFMRQDEERMGYTDNFGLTTLEAYYGNWTVKAYRMGVLVGEANIPLNQSKMDLNVQCNVRDLTVIVVDQYGQPTEANVSLRNDEYDLSFSGCIHKPMENITFAQIPLMNYTLTIEADSTTQTYTVNTSQIGQVHMIRTLVREVGITWFEIIICILIGTIVGSVATWARIRKRSRALSARTLKVQ